MIIDTIDLSFHGALHWSSAVKGPLGEIFLVDKPIAGKTLVVGVKVSLLSACDDPRSERERERER